MITSLVLAAVLALGPAAESSGTIRLPWYGSPYFGRRTACGQRYTRWTVGVAVRPGSGYRCGDLVELRFGHQVVVAPVIDTFSPSAPDWVRYDASARIACHLLNPPALRAPKGRALGVCFTRNDVRWRDLPRRRGRP